MTILNCICLKYGTLYGPEYVTRLAAGVRRNTSFDVRFFCMTDDRSGIPADIEILDLPDEPFRHRLEIAQRSADKKSSPLKKISMFRPELIPDLVGPLMIFDLDIVVLGDLDAMRDFAPGKVCMRREWKATPKNGHIGHGSVERVDPALHGYLYDFISGNPEAAVALGRGSEQAYTSRLAEQNSDFAAYPDEWIASFKYDCRPPRPLNLVMRPRLPKGAKVVCFHGNPKMTEAMDGYASDPLHSTRACPWLRDAWLGTGGTA